MFPIGRLCRLGLRIVIECLSIMESVVWNDGGIWWSACDLLETFLRPSYRYQGSGISYRLAREVVTVRTRLGEIRAQEPTVDLGPLYLAYLRSHCALVIPSRELEGLFRRLIVLHCLDLESLVVQRTYDHPVFGPTRGQVSLDELLLEKTALTRYDVFDLVVDRLQALLHEPSPVCV